MLAKPSISMSNAKKSVRLVVHPVEVIVSPAAVGYSEKERAVRQCLTGRRITPLSGAGNTQNVRYVRFFCTARLSLASCCFMLGFDLRSVVVFRFLVVDQVHRRVGKSRELVRIRAADLMSLLRKTRAQESFTPMFVVADAIFTHPVSVGCGTRFFSKCPR